MNGILSSLHKSCSGILQSTTSSRTPNRNITFRCAALFTTVLFFAGMSLWGTTKYAGYFYVLSLVIGAPLLIAMRPWKVAVAPSIRVYGLFYTAFLILCIGHTLFRDAHPGTIEYAGRFLLGLFNGYFFFHLFGGDRRSLFRFVTLIAGAHLTIAVGYTLYYGFDFGTRSILGLRPGGNTNPIPYALLFISSAGIVALALTDRIHAERKLLMIACLAIALAATLLGGAVNGSRGPLITIPLLLILVAALLWLRAGKAWSFAFVSVVLVAFLAAAAVVFQREPQVLLTTWGYLTGDAAIVRGLGGSTERYDLWIAAMRLIPEQPIWGFGFSSMPEILNHPAAFVPSDSPIHVYGHIHNEYLDILLKAGIVGAVLFYAPMLLSLGIAWRKLMDPELQACAIVIVWIVGAQLIYGMTSVMFSHASTTHQFGVYLGMLLFSLLGSCNSGSFDRDPLNSRAD